MKYALLAATAFALTAFSTSAFADCRVTGSGFSWGSDAEVSMTTSPGKACGISMSMQGSVTSIKLLTAPKNGRAGTISMSGFGYIPKPGFTGKDSFQVRAEGYDFTHKGPIVFTVSVTVE